MKNLSILFALTIICFGCEKNETESLTLDRTTVDVTMINELCEFAIVSGSGSYAVSTDKPEIATVTITGNIVTIETLKEGYAVITVTDKKSGDKAECSLRVNTAVLRFEIASMQYAVDADDADAKKAIEDELKTPPYPIGSKFEWLYPVAGSQTDRWVVKTAEGTVIISGTATHKRLESQERDYFDSYSLLKIEGGLQQYYMRIFNIDLGDKAVVYYMYNVDGLADTRLNSPPLHISHARLYEDLTDYYKNKYSDAGVKGVVRVQQCNYY